MYHQEEQKNILEDLIKDRQKSRGETFCYYHRVADKIYWGTNDEMREQMREWKKQRIDGDITLYEENKNEFKIGKRTYYTFVITPLEVGKAEAIGLDPLGIGMSYLVDGYIYWFVKKENRDAVFNYVMGKK